MPTARFGKTTLGVGVPDYWKFHDEARDYADFTRLYSRWLEGPAPIDPFATAEDQAAERTLNWRVFGHAEPSLLDLVQCGWRPNQHRGPLGLWDLQRLDVTGIHDEVARERMDDYMHGRILPKVLRDEYGMRPITAGEVAERTLSEVWARNIITDNGATSMLKNAWNNAGSAVAIFSHIGISFGNRSYAVLTTALTSGQTLVTSLACTGGIQVAAMPNSSPITVSYGTANAETFNTTASAGAQGATSIAVTSQTSANAHAVNDYIVTQPAVTDNPSSAVANWADSGALPGGDFTFTGSGAGNRQVAIAFTFSTSTAAGAYTEAYTANVAAISATNQTASHLIFPPQTINSTTSLAITITEKV